MLRKESETLNWLKEKIKNLSPYHLIILYLLLIPAFAIMYSIIPSHFYHSTIKLENSYKNTAFNISQELKTEFIQNIVRENKLDKEKIILNYDTLNLIKLAINRKWKDTINLSTLKISDVTTDGTFILFKLHYFINRQIFESDGLGKFSTGDYVNIKCSLSADPFSKHVLYIQRENAIEQNPTFLALGLSKIYTTIDHKDGHFELYISENLRMMINSYLFATNGLQTYQVNFLGCYT